MNFFDPSGHMRVPGYVNGIWHLGPEIAEFERGSSTYQMLVIFGIIKPVKVRLACLRPEKRGNLKKFVISGDYIGRIFMDVTLYLNGF